MSNFCLITFIDMILSRRVYRSFENLFFFIKSHMASGAQIGRV